MCALTMARILQHTPLSTVGTHRSKGSNTIRQPSAQSARVLDRVTQEERAVAFIEMIDLSHFAVVKRRWVGTRDVCGFNELIILNVLLEYCM